MKLLREPLLHFLLIGAALFGVYRSLNPAGTALSRDRIVITRARTEALRDAFRFTYQRPPEPSELDTLIDNEVRDEVLVREARALGFDKDDGLIRERLIGKMRFALGDSLSNAARRMRQHYTVEVER